MAKVRKLINEDKGVKFHHDQYLIMCLGCGYGHALGLKAEGGNHIFNMDFDKPTFSPSLLQNFNKDRICHSFIKDGNIQYLEDCFHHLKGQTIELPEI